jgi:hypothetical protein
MRDPGALAILVTAPILARIGKLDDESYAESVADLRRTARERPRYAGDLPVATISRAMAWVALTVLGLPVLILGSVTGLGVVRVAGITVMLFCAGMVLVSGLRFGFAKYYEGSPGYDVPLKRFVVPAWPDAIVGLVFVACFGPQAY